MINLKRLFLKKNFNLLSIISIQIFSAGIWFLLSIWFKYTDPQSFRAGIIYTILGVILWTYGWKKNE
jgi:uncharacterized membrane protein YczE